MLRRLLGQAVDRRMSEPQGYVSTVEVESNANVRERIHHKLMMNREILQLEQGGTQEYRDLHRHNIRTHKRSASTGSGSYSRKRNQNETFQLPDLSAAHTEDTGNWEHPSNDYDLYLYDDNDLYNSESKYYEDVDGYLTEQNRKFNQLIDKNLDYVAHGNLTDIYKDDSPPRNGGRKLGFDQEDYNLVLMDRVLMNLDDESRFKLYQKLANEFNPPANNRMIQYSLLNQDKDYIKTLSAFEKCELVMILMIKLNFLLLKYSIPMTKRLYRKFMSNQLLLVNNDNFNRLLNLIIKLLNNLEDNYYQRKDLTISDTNVIDAQLNQLDQWNFSNNGDPGQGHMTFGMNPLSLNPFKVMGVVYDYYRGRESLDLLNAAEQFVNQI